jgi:prepilin-type N-terminal cleavage/methylation domain-containing protein
MRNRGFSLTELAIVMTIVGFLFVLAFPLSTAYLISERRNATAKKLANIELALLNYAMANKRLPCPALGTNPIEDVNAGLEGARAGGACLNSQASGVVPWKVLGISAADTLDEWYNQTTYRVAYHLTADNSLDMSACDTAGTKAAAGSNQGCDSTTIGGSFSAGNYTSPANFLANKGLNVDDGSNLVMDYATRTGAAYVLISHGENGYGSLSSGGTSITTAAVGVAGTTQENPNRNLNTLLITNGAPPALRNAPYRPAGDNTSYFDDIVATVSVFNLINKAQLGPRAH